MDSVTSIALINPSQHKSSEHAGHEHEPPVSLGSSTEWYRIARDAMLFVMAVDLSTRSCRLLRDLGNGMLLNAAFDEERATLYAGIRARYESYRLYSVRVRTNETCVRKRHPALGFCV